MANTSFKNPTHPQTGSLLFSQFPTEIRLQIYQEVISTWHWTKRIHIIFRQCLDSDNNRGDSIPTYVPCAVSPEDQHEPTVSEMVHYQREPMVSNLAIFWTCQRLYTEAIGFLYSAPTFDFLSFMDACNFLKCIPLQNLNSINSLHLTGSAFRSYYPTLLPTDVNLHANWLEVCSILERMEGLQELRINIRSTPPDMANEKELLKALLAVRVMGKGKFVVQIPRTASGGEDRLRSDRDRDITDEEILNDSDRAESGLHFRIERRTWAGEVETTTEIGLAVHHGRPRRKKRRWLCFPCWIIIRLGVVAWEEFEDRVLHID
ncbi:uncharacterized protein BP5553_02990 [Venustampulla echinocandica]|uniref:DUF7730 domain-containing protein n=1 Tax=Venustampulla echinocandica TaxID=2656787 RepID=A0A370TSY3_9HELO|nr:uncharacterized protein BP5553_02990 [Venustampulla echinocandica]RDL38650.1 hypothetical protein BP5553_02990 [Venustampulla echinocandica]